MVSVVCDVVKWASPWKDSRLTCPGHTKRGTRRGWNKPDVWMHPIHPPPVLRHVCLATSPTTTVCLIAAGTETARTARPQSLAAGCQRRAKTALNRINRGGFTR